jgi:hypothetical protein
MAGMVTRHFWKIIRCGVDGDFDEADPPLRLKPSLDADSPRARGLAEGLSSHVELQPTFVEERNAAFADVRAS